MWDIGHHNIHTVLGKSPLWATCWGTVLLQERICSVKMKSLWPLRKKKRTLSLWLMRIIREDELLKQAFFQFGNDREWKYMCQVPQIGLAKWTIEEKNSFGLFSSVHQNYSVSWMIPKLLTCSMSKLCSYLYTRYYTQYLRICMAR